MPAASLRALLEHSIDYAGLFPPTTLALEPALQNQAGYVRTTDAWMLGAFILPFAQFGDAAQSISQFDREHPLRVSALGKKPADAATFRESLIAARDSIRAFREKHGATAAITQLEMPFPEEADGDLLQAARAALNELHLNVFWEGPADDAERLIGLIAESNAAKSGRAFGFKLRTGGVTADAFPDSVQTAAALVTAGQRHVPIKFTAGLHHPVRQFHPSVQTKMHGFLNVLGAGVLAIEHDWSEGETADMLNDERAESFSFDDASFAWREWEIATDRIRMHRKLITSLGSCSFDEPREDLRALKIL
jgi:hypothetical protein